MLLYYLTTNFTQFSKLNRALESIDFKSLYFEEICAFYYETKQLSFQSYWITLLQIFSTFGHARAVFKIYDRDTSGF